MPAARRVAGGNQQLALRLLERGGARVRLGKRVRTVRRVDAPGCPYAIEREGSLGALCYDYVVLAAPHALRTIRLEGFGDESGDPSKSWATSLASGVPFRSVSIWSHRSNHVSWQSCWRVQPG